MIPQQKISPHLWFATEAEEAAKFYCSVFKDSKILNTNYYTEEGFEIHKMPAGSVLTVEFMLEGQKFMALNGGPLFKFNESVSFVVHCSTQNEIDYYWESLRQAGDPAAQQCGWLKDKFGLSWQIVPIQLDQMMLDKDKNRFNRVMHVMLQMKKLDIARLEAAYKDEVLA